ncbi:hypothetical protein J4232_00820 [Candidatus Woesearchaeota archaeon]|nr:hypothetical protein [Candidatus Woesearchaeota archaeon]
MNQKQLGIIVLIFSLLLGILFFFHYLNNINNIVEFMRLSNGTCFNEQGECLHAKPDYIAFGGFAVALFLLGLSIYLIFLDKTQRLLVEQNKQAADVLRKAKELKESNQKRERFDAFLQGFDEKKRLILKAIHEQEGIQQSTLKYRTGMSKTELSLLLKDLEDKKIITREDSGKTKKVYLKKVL